MAGALELDRNAIEGFVFGSLALRGDGAKDFTGRARRSLAWYKAIESRAASAVPFALVHDLGSLLLDGDQFAFRTLFSFADIPEETRDVRLSYENAFLNTLLRDIAFQRARMAVQRDPSRDELIVRILQCILRPLLKPGKPAYDLAPRLNPQLVRELSLYGGFEPDKHAARFVELVGEPGFFERCLRQCLDALLASDVFLSEEDLSEVEHWDAYLGREDLRMTGRRIAYHATRIRPADRRRFPLREEEPEVDSELTDAGTYPQGGFSELSTQGRPENLVPSELIYLGEGNLTGLSQDDLAALREAAAGSGVTPTVIDLFAYRFVSNELLYYMRESGQLKRVRRTVHFVLEPDPPSEGADGDYQGLRWREPGLSRVKDRLVVIMLGFAVRLAQDLGIIFSKDSVRFEIHILARHPAVRADAERDAELLAVLLEHELKAGKVVIHVEDALDLRESIEKSRRVYALSVQYKDQAPPGLSGDAPVPKRLRATVLRLGGSAEDTALDNVQTVRLPLDEAFLEHIHRARDGVLSEITGSRSRR